MSRLVFWICVLAAIVYAEQNHWFDGIGRFFNMIKSDVEYQRSLVPKEEEIDDGGVLSVEQGEKKVVRKNGLGTVYGGR